MEISFSQSFLDNLERIDNKVVIDGVVVDNGGLLPDPPHVICHGKKVQACVEGISGECDRLDFYCSGEIGFTITGERIVMNPERTIFEFNLPSEPNAIIECPGLTEDTKFLESIGTDLGNSLYKDIPVSDESLVWKETIGKYVVDRGIQDNHSYDVELFDTKSGVLEERPIRFKSYQGITIEQGNMEVDMLMKSVVVKHDVYTGISDTSFLVWDSPMIDAKVNLDAEPECLNKIGEYVDPGNVIYGNTDCFQFTNYNSSLVGFKITGTEGSKVEVLFNRESSGGSFTTFEGTIGEDGVVEIRFSDLPYLHFNGIRAVGPSKVTEIDTIMFLEEIVDEYSQNPDKTYIAKLNNVDCTFKVNGVCDYIEYEKYLGEIKEIGKGSDSINSIPGLIIEPVENESEGLYYEIMNLEKQIKISKDYSVSTSIHYATFKVSIDNNIEVNGNTITTSRLYADYKVKIEQDGTIWKINTSPDYINVDPEEGEHGIFLLDYKANSNREFEIITNDPRTSDPHYDRVRPQVVPGQGWEDVFSVSINRSGVKVIDGERWTTYKVNIIAGENTGDTWRPKKPGTNDPYLISIYYISTVIDSISFYAIQLKQLKDTAGNPITPIEVWEETIIPGQFTKVESKTTLLNTMTKNFIVVKPGNSEEESGANWYYYDLLGTNRFYITDQSFQITNVGLEFITSSDTTLLDLGTGERRSKFGRVINANRSDLIGSIGTLVVTESPSFPGTWRDLIDNNTVNIEVERELDNIYVQVGSQSNNLKNEDIEVTVDSISTFGVYIKSNFKYVIQTYGYLRICPNLNISDFSGDLLPDKKEVFRNYNDAKNIIFALIKLDEDKGVDESYIEIRSGSLVRKITLNLDYIKKEHDYLFSIEGSPVDKPNIIRIFNNDTISSPKETFLYSSSTTPKIEVSGINKPSDETSPRFYGEGSDIHYGNHKSELTITVPNSKSLTYSKYPMKSFGYVREMSKDYSDSEIIEFTGATSYLEYLLYMKGKEHFLWCVDTLGGFSSLSDPRPTTSDPSKYENRYDMVLDADGETGKTIYVVSRYDVSNRTFITEYPEETEFKIKRDELEANIKISPQQSIGLDERSQIEYAIPIQVSCNVENNRGNIFLGSLNYTAKTVITEDSLTDVIEVDSNIVARENINTEYISDKITSDKTQNLSIMIFQLGTDKTVFDLYSKIPDLGIWATTNYVIPEIGSNYNITGLTVTKSVNPDGGSGEDIVTVTSEWDPKYFLVRVDSLERVRDNGSYKHWYLANNLPMSLIQNTQYVLSIKASVEGSTETKDFDLDFIKYGCNYGLYVNGQVGFGVAEDPNGWGTCAGVQVSNEGGSIKVHAGIFYAVNGKETTEALMVPAEYKFIGDNQPISFSWQNGNLDDDGNLSIVLPPRTRDEDGDKLYTLEVIQPHEYYPIKLYINFYQSSLHGDSPDTEKTDYHLMFLDEEVNILSNGTVVGNEERKFYFVHNLPESEFDKVFFSWKQKDPESWIPFEPDELQLEEEERSFKDGYVKLKFKPNGSHMFIDAYIMAYYKVGGDSRPIGKLSAKQGYFCLITEYYNPHISESSYISNYTPYENPMSRLSPVSDWLYHYTQGHGQISSKESLTPCKSNNDNSNSDSIYGRGVYKLTAWKKEYYDERETKYNDLSKIFNSSEVLFISPEMILDSYGINFVGESSSSDHDAKTNPIRHGGDLYATNVNFGNYCPYFELSYNIKEEYFREYNIITASCKFILKHPDTGELVDFYILVSNNLSGSSEPQDVETLEFSDYNLKWDYKGGVKQVSYNPASFYDLLRLSLVNSSIGWVTDAYKQSDSNYIYFKVSENSSEGDNKAYYRNTQAKVDVIDDRSGVSEILKTFYFNLEQEPDIQQTSGGGGGDTPTTNTSIKIKFKNERGDVVEFTGEVMLMVSVTLSDGTLYTATINATLPNTNLRANNFSVQANDTSLTYTSNCVAEGSIISADVIASLNSTITGCTVSWYNATTDERSDNYLLPYSISGESGKFKDGGTYTITFSASS